MKVNWIIIFSLGIIIGFTIPKLFTKDNININVVENKYDLIVDSLQSEIIIRDSIYSYELQNRQHVIDSLQIVRTNIINKYENLTNKYSVISNDSISSYISNKLKSWK